MSNSFFFFFSSRRRHTRCGRDWSSDVCSSDLQAKADPGNIGYLQFCPSIQSTWENIRGLKGAKPPLFAECLEPSDHIRIIYRAQHNEEGSRFWQKTNENMILFVSDPSRLATSDKIHRWASLSQLKAMMLMDNVVGPYVRTVVASL